MTVGLRRTPMKRKRTTPRRKGPPAPRIAKDTNYRSPTLLALAEHAPHCMGPWCKARNRGDVVGCHSNLQEHGKGMGLKAHDIPAYLCARCHALLDGREPGWTEQERELRFYQAMFQTFLWLLQQGYLRPGRHPVAIAYGVGGG